MIYLDNNATTPFAPELTELAQELSQKFGNPSSLHQYGRQARCLIDEAREIFSEGLGIPESSLIFTSGATESLNSVLLNTFLDGKKGVQENVHLLISSVEHAAVLETAAFLETLGIQVSQIPVDAKGKIDLDLLENLLRPNTKMLAVMLANNEIGNIYPIQKIAEIAKRHGILFLCDAVQALGRIPLKISELPIDFLAASAHKFHGPKGVGLLYVKPGSPFNALLHGGRQERGKRAGTENVAGIYLAAKAFELAQQNRNESLAHLQKLKEVFTKAIQEKIPTAIFHGDEENQLFNTVNFRIPGLSGESLAMNLDLAGIAVSVGSACDSGSIDPSHVLLAMGLSPEEAIGGLRFSFSRYNSLEEIEQAADYLGKIANNS